MHKIKVYVRIRPLNQLEISHGHECSWVRHEQSVVNNDSRAAFTFDDVYDQSNDLKIYDNVAAELVTSVMNGYNATIIAYGQTSSGKTHTMIGNGQNPGIIPNAIMDVFKCINNSQEREFLLRVSYLEIYNEVINDLLQPENIGLKIHETPNREVYVGNLSEVVVCSQDQVYNLMDKGNKNRAVGDTRVNGKSSRSHSIFRLIIESKAKLGDLEGSVLVSTLNLVDLAGSERVRYTGAEGVRLKEAGNINKSLLALSTVIGKLSNRQDKHIPYRDSKLTRILQSALGGNSKTSIVCTITPSNQYSEDTLSTLKFASRAKTITNNPELNEIVSDDVLLKRYKKEIDSLKRELDSMKPRDNHATAFTFEDENKRLIQNKLENVSQVILDSYTLKKSFSLRRKTWHPLTSSSCIEEGNTRDNVQFNLPPILPAIESDSVNSMSFIDVQNQPQNNDHSDEISNEKSILTESLDTISTYHATIQQLLAKNELLQESFIDRERELCNQLKNAMTDIRQLNRDAACSKPLKNLGTINTASQTNALLTPPNQDNYALIDALSLEIVNRMFDSLHQEKKLESLQHKNQSRTIGTQTPHGYTFDQFTQTNPVIEYNSASSRNPKTDRIPCSFCDKSYIGHNRLSRHMKEKHPDVSFGQFSTILEQSPPVIGENQENTNATLDHTDKSKEINADDAIPKKRKLKGQKGKVTIAPLKPVERSIKYEGW